MGLEHAIGSTLTDDAYSMAEGGDWAPMLRELENGVRRRWRRRDVPQRARRVDRRRGARRGVRAVVHERRRLPEPVSDRARGARLEAQRVCRAHAPARAAERRGHRARAGRAGRDWADRRMCLAVPGKIVIFTPNGRRDAAIRGKVDFGGVARRCASPSRPRRRSATTCWCTSASRSARSTRTRRGRSSSTSRDGGARRSSRSGARP